MKLPEALKGGTEAMREAGTEFLPQEEGESEVKYQIRLQRSTLYEGYTKTIGRLAGEVFKEDIDISENTPEDHQEWFKNVDLEGNGLNTFMKQIFQGAIHEGVQHILVDYPQVTGKTVADHKAAGAQPYLVKIRPDQIIGWRFGGKGEGRTLTQLRIKETAELPDGEYGVKEVERIRVLTPGAWEVFERAKGGKGEAIWVTARDEDGNEMKGSTTLDVIPLVTIMLGEKMSDMTARPPLLPLAHLNRSHWESSSDQRNILHYARLVTFFGKLLEEPEDGSSITVGANRLITSDDPNGDFKVVEHSGAAIEAGRQDLEDLKTDMAMYGLTFLIPKKGQITATEKNIDSSENNSELHSWGRLLDAMLAKCYELMCKYVSSEPVGVLKSNNEFKDIFSTTDADILLKAFQLGLLSREVVIEELKARKLITTEVDLQDLVAELEANQKTNTALAALSGFGQNQGQQQGRNGLPPD
jgi:hypothetical protein